MPERLGFSNECPGIMVWSSKSGRSRLVPVYQEPDKTRKSLSGKPHNLPQLKTIIGIIGAGRDQKSRI